MNAQENPRATHAAFSLVELLMVIMLLTVLMMVAFPAFRGLQRATYRHRAVAECDALCQATLAYRRTYGQWPHQVETSGESISALIVGRAVNERMALSNVVAVLRGTDRVRNPRSMVFLEVPDDRLDADGTLLDPWQQPYVLVLADFAENRPTRAGGGVFATVTSSGGGAAHRTYTVNAPEDAVAFSWGDPAMASTNRVIGSWSRR